MRGSFSLGFIDDDTSKQRTTSIFRTSAVGVDSFNINRAESSSSTDCDAS